MNRQVATSPQADLYRTPTTDPQLLQACRTGDEQAWQALLAKYERLVHSVPLHYGLPREDAADIAQIVFTALIQSLDTLGDESNLSSWLVLVARRHAWRTLRSRQQDTTVEWSEASLTPLLPDRARPGDLATLPPTVHGLLLQRFVDSRQYRQQPGLFQRRQAGLAFDSLHQPLSAGLRAGADEALRHYLYAIDLADVVLNVQPGWYGDRLDLIGQILPNLTNLAVDTFIVQLLHYEHEAAITLADRTGSFWFAALEPGPYALLLSIDTLEIEVPVFALAYE